MNINLNTRIKALLDVDREKVIDSLIKINRNFSKLRNPVLRNLLARRVTIAEACKIAGCSPGDFFSSMKAIGFVIDETMKEPVIEKVNTIDFELQTNVYELDVRPLLSKDQDPLKEILNLAKRIGPGERIKIINSFEPVPLINLLAEKGFLHFTEVVGEKLIITWFEKTAHKISLTALPAEVHDEAQQGLFDKVLSRFPAHKIKYIDVRELEMPQPMIQILAQLEKMNADELLYIYHKKVPIYLLSELNRRGLLSLLNRKSADELDMLIYRS
ncbi:DUF2249 domain-containing protein [Pedobacter nyackensis]|uniref:Uncharacterized conserved protein n=1 Tax=Pedobacter nyackensis TaxID=475255 RepID=A0A1W2DVZ4_9SPHI|nr:DUF2249 domain-containing protein [Pedobacter nyackensis]SMD01654.1 Uncharacterized conserved protein [Pedobacter nyackensis]